MQADAVAADLAGGREVRDEPRVDVEVNALAVGALRRQRLQGLEVLAELALLALQAPILAHHPTRGLDIEPATVAVDDEFTAVDDTRAQVADAHYRRHAQRPRQDRDVGVRRAGGRDHAHKALPGDLGELRGVHLVPHQHHPLRQRPGPALAGAEPGDQPPAYVANVTGALAQVAVLHVLEVTDLFDNDVAHRPGRPHALADARFHGAGQALTVEQPHVDLEEPALLLRDHALEAGVEVLKVGAHRGNGRTKRLDLGLRVVGGDLRDRIEIRRRIQRVGMANADTGGAGDTGQRPVARQAAALDQLAQPAAGPGVGDNAGKLGGHGDQESHLLVVEALALLALHHHHAEELAVVDDGHAEEGVEVLLPGLGEEAEARMLIRVLEIDRLLAFGDQADQALVET